MCIIYEHLDYRLLKSFLAIAEEGTFIAAATKLAVSQSALSYQISQFESILEFKLLDRENGNTPTPEGEILLRFARENLQSRKDIIDMMRAIHAGSLMPLRLGFSPFVEKNLLGIVTRTYKAILPKCEILADGGDDTNELVQRVRNGGLDAALVTLPVSEEGIQINVLDSDGLLVCMRSDDPMASFDSVPACALNGKLSLFIYQRYHPAAHAHLQEKFQKLGITLRPSQPTMNCEHVQWLVKEGYCYALARKSRPVLNGLVARPIMDAEWTIDTALISKPGHLHPALSLLIAELTKALRMSGQALQQKYVPPADERKPVRTAVNKSKSQQNDLFAD